MARRIPAIEKLSKESQSLYDAVNDEPDLPCVLISTSFLDQCLASLLERFFIQSDTAQRLLNPNGALGTFSDRADLCYCLGLIPKRLFQNLRTISEIRNLFAHSYLSLSFDDAEIAEKCHSLTLPGVRMAFRVPNSTNPPESNYPWSQIQSPRDRFAFATVMMANRLMLTGLDVERRPILESGW